MAITIKTLNDIVPNDKVYAVIIDSKYPTEKTKVWQCRVIAKEKSNISTSANKNIILVFDVSLPNGARQVVVQQDGVVSIDGANKMIVSTDGAFGVTAIHASKMGVNCFKKEVCEMFK